MEPTTEIDERPRTRRWARLLGPVLWPSFLVAGVATAIFFAHIDPLTLRAQTLPEWQISRQAGYTVGFLMFWAICAASSALTAYLGMTSVPGSPGPRSGR